MQRELIHTHRELFYEKLFGWGLRLLSEQPQFVIALIGWVQGFMLKVPNWGSGSSGA